MARSKLPRDMSRPPRWLNSLQRGRSAVHWDVHLSARRPSAGAVPGRWGACLAVRAPPAAVFTSQRAVVSSAFLPKSRRVPELHFPPVAVAAGGGQELAVAAVGQAHHVAD